MKTSHLALTLSLSLAGFSGLALAAPPDPTGGKFTIEEATKGLGKGTLTAKIETTMGAFHCELFEQDAPGTVANFVGLARGLRPFVDPGTGDWVRRPFYDGLIFHRVIPTFMIQGGDIKGNGTGEPGYTIVDEKNAPHSFSRGGILAMANRGRNTGGSQFFITEQEQPPLDDGGAAGGHYQIFGQCPEVDLVKKIARVPRNPMDRPLSDVKITKVTIERVSKEPAQTPKTAAKPAAKPSK
ncbi:MAG TPA: peptidylprolyl isomerase [Pseudomonadota bacterium]|nr:peptidylprolyl isomerase [Pseudomonadota bacterium]HNN54099.1 peptidylprolyl isomerase [Pseudomonadota bacterium]